MHFTNFKIIFFKFKKIILYVSTISTAHLVGGLKGIIFSPALSKAREKQVGFTYGWREDGTHGAL